MKDRGLMTELYEMVMTEAQDLEQRSALLSALDHDQDFVLGLGRIMARAYVAFLIGQVQHPDIDLLITVHAWIISVDDVSPDGSEGTRLVIPPSIQAIIRDTPKVRDQFVVLGKRVEAAINAAPTFAVRLEVGVGTMRGLDQLVEGGEDEPMTEEDIDLFARLTHDLDLDEGAEGLSER